MHDSDGPDGGPRRFTTTQWSVILAAGDTGNHAAQQALSRLFEGVEWRPMLGVLAGIAGFAAMIGAFGLTPPPSQSVQNPGFESGLASWYTQGVPIPSTTYSHSGDYSVMMSRLTC